MSGQISSDEEIFGQNDKDQHHQRQETEDLCETTRKSK